MSKLKIEKTEWVPDDSSADSEDSFTTADEPEGHLFKTNTFSKTAYCNVCNRLIFGVFTHGLHCRICGMVVHKDCKKAAESIFCDATKQKRKASFFSCVGPETEDDRMIAVKIANRTDKIVYAGFYTSEDIVIPLLSRGVERHLAVKPTPVMADSVFPLKLPAGKVNLDTHIVFAHNRKELLNVLTPSMRDSLPVKQMGFSRAFFVDMDDGLLRVGNAFQKVGHFFEDHLEELSERLDDWRSPFDRIREEKLKASPYGKEKAGVRVGSSPCKEELDFIRARETVVLGGISRLLGKPYEAKRPLRVAVALSGGGVRACISGAGFIEGLAQSGVLDTVSWLAGLSGGSWSVGSWLASGKPISEFNNQLCRNFVKHPVQLPHHGGMRHIMNMLRTKVLFGQPITLVDYYAGLLGNTLLYRDEDPESRLTDTLSQQAVKLVPERAHERPYPILSLVQPCSDTVIDDPTDDKIEETKYRWWELTPHEISINLTNLHTPTWSHGRTFISGETVDFDPEVPLADWLGICGSAFAVNIKEFTRIKGKKLSTFERHILTNLADSAAGKVRLSHGKFRNFTFGMNESEFRRVEEVKLIDAGIDVNAPVTPFLHRGVDLLIIFDASRDYDMSDNHSEVLKRAEHFVNQRPEQNLKFPKIDYNGVGRRTVSIFPGSIEQGCPTVAYMPLEKCDSYDPSYNPDTIIEDGGYLHFMNFQYTEEQANKLRGLSRQIAIESTPALIETFARLMEELK